MTTTLPSIGKAKQCRSKSTVPSNTAIQRLRQQLLEEDKMKTIPKSQYQLMQSIVQDADVIMGNRKLEMNLYKLKDLGVLKNYTTNIAYQPGLKKSDYVLNDYHSKSTTNGYSRNYGGTFYNR